MLSTPGYILYTISVDHLKEIVSSYFTKNPLMHPLPGWDGLGCSSGDAIPGGTFNSLGCLK